MAVHTLSLGPEIIRLLMPHRRPFLMVDRIVSYSSEPAPVLRAVKHISANEGFFDGHFPDIALMPGAMTFEGLGQTAHLLSVINELRDKMARDGFSEEQLFAAFANVEYGYTLNRAFNAAKAEEFKSRVLQYTESTFGMVGAVHLKFLEPIFAGTMVEYQAVLAGALDDYLNYQVEACVDGHTKVRGTISSIKGLGVESMVDPGTEKGRLHR